MLIPKNVFFIIVSPCVNGNTPEIFRIAFGITSIGSVQKINIRKLMILFFMNMVSQLPHKTNRMMLQSRES